MVVHSRERAAPRSAGSSRPKEGRARVRCMCWAGMLGGVGVFSESTAGFGGLRWLGGLRARRTSRGCACHGACVRLCGLGMLVRDACEARPCEV